MRYGRHVRGCCSGTDRTIERPGFTEETKMARFPASLQQKRARTLSSQQEQHNHLTPLERSYFWGNGLGIDGYACPGARRPLWGY